MPHRPAAVAFDLDGTLIDSESLVQTAYAAAGTSFGVTIDDALFRSCVGQHREATTALLRARFGADFPMEAFRERVSAVIGDRAAPLKRGARPLLDHLARIGLPVGLCTSSGRAWVARHLEAHALTARFHAVVTREDVARHKPDPEPYLAVAAALGHPPAAMLALEDSAAGLTAAHRAGARPVLVPDLLPPTAESRAQAEWVATSLDDVLDWFLQANS